MAYNIPKKCNIQLLWDRRGASTPVAKADGRRHWHHTGLPDRMGKIRSLKSRDHVAVLNYQKQDGLNYHNELQSQAGWLVMTQRAMEIVKRALVLKGKRDSQHCSINTIKRNQGWLIKLLRTPVSIESHGLFPISKPEPPFRFRTHWFYVELPWENHTTP